jgi:hypothetical protein
MPDVGFLNLGWLRRGQQPAEPPPAWQVRTESGEVVAEDGRGKVYRVAFGGARAVRVVPLTGGNVHHHGPGWQVALQRDDGDVLVGPSLGDWRVARDLARQVCTATELPLDELTERLFSQVGRYST